VLDALMNGNILIEPCQDEIFDVKVGVLPYVYFKSLVSQLL
jgi:hypothetical protein